VVEWLFDFWPSPDRFSSRLGGRAVFDHCNHLKVDLQSSNQLELEKRSSSAYGVAKTIAAITVTAPACHGQLETPRNLEACLDAEWEGGTQIGQT
jgi:hypothetical protein